MADAIKFYKVATVPVGPFEPNAIYLVPTGPREDDFSIYVANGAGTAVKKTMNRTDVDNLIAGVIGGYEAGVIVADIAARNALAPTKYTQCLVVDASADPTVNAGAATYVYSTAQTAWIKISEAESMDMITSWGDIVGRPTSSVGAIDGVVNYVNANTADFNTLLGWATPAHTTLIDALVTWGNAAKRTAVDGVIAYLTTNQAGLDDAIAKKHAHANAVELAKVGEDAQGFLLYDGEYPRARLEVAAW